jgi:hypothetical protein
MGLDVVGSGDDLECRGEGGIEDLVAATGCLLSGALGGWRGGGELPIDFHAIFKSLGLVLDGLHNPRAGDDAVWLLTEGLASGSLRTRKCRWESCSLIINSRNRQMENNRTWQLDRGLLRGRPSSFAAFLTDSILRLKEYHDVSEKGWRRRQYVPLAQRSRHPYQRRPDKLR